MEKDIAKGMLFLHLGARPPGCELVPHREFLPLNRKGWNLLSTRDKVKKRNQILTVQSQFSHINTHGLHADTHGHPGVHIYIEMKQMNCLNSLTLLFNLEPRAPNCQVKQLS